MYSNNDYRYYLEHRLSESDDFLAHYGVKGMKWKDHKYVNPREFVNSVSRGVKRVGRYVGSTFESNNDDWRNRKIKKLQKKKSPVDKYINKQKQKIKKAQGKIDKKRPKQAEYQKRIDDYKNKNTKYDKIDRRIKAGVKDFKKEATDAYKSTKKDIERVSKIGKEKAKKAYDQASKRVERGVKDFKKEASDAYKSQKKDIERLVKKASKNKSRMATNSAYDTAKSKAQDVTRTAKRKASSAYNSAKNTAKNAADKAKSTAKKTYKYVDDHVDRYSYNERHNGKSYRATGVRVKTKKATTDLGVYGRSSSYTDLFGNNKSNSDYGVELYRNNKKRRKKSYRSVGVGSKYSIPVYVYRSASEKY